MATSHETLCKVSEGTTPVAPPGGAYIIAVMSAPGAARTLVLSSTTNMTLGGAATVENTTITFPSPIFTDSFTGENQLWVVYYTA